MKTFKEVAIAVLKEAERPLHSRDIARIALKKRRLKVVRPIYRLALNIGEEFVEYIENTAKRVLKIRSAKGRRKRKVHRISFIINFIEIDISTPIL
jgi:hypothetical protein